MLALVGCRLIDGTGAGPLEDATVLIDQGRIVAVGRRQAIPVPPDATRIDAAGKTVMPGLIDAHVHITMAEFGGLHSLTTPLSLTFYEAIAYMRSTLEAGVTTVRDAGGADLGMKLAVERGLIAGPRLVISVGVLSQTGGHGDPYLPSGADWAIPYPGQPWLVCDGPDEARKATRKAIRAGADVIKVTTSGGVLSYADEVDSSQFSMDELRVIVDEAHAAHKRVMSHAQSKSGILNALKAGIESIEHGVFLDAECIDLMLTQGTFLVPTLFAAISVKEAADRSGRPLPPHVLRKGLAVLEAHKRNIALAVAAGVKIAMGTDAGVAGHGDNARELELLVEVGMSPMQAIVASTKVGAECLDLGSKLGTLEPGKLADLLVVNGDPLADIRVLQDKQRIEMVIKEGDIVVDRRPAHLTQGSAQSKPQVDH